MKIAHWLYGLVCFLSIAGLCSVVAMLSAQIIEESSKKDVMQIWADHNVTWPVIEADGLKIFVLGDAPDEVERFRAIALAGQVVDAARIIDQVNVARLKNEETAELSLEFLKRETDMSIYGVLPRLEDEHSLETFLRDEIDPDIKVRWLVEHAEQSEPLNWTAMVRLAVFAMGQLEFSKVSISQDGMHIDGLVYEEKDKDRLTGIFEAKAKEGITLSHNLIVPRPMIAPFVFRAERQQGKTTVKLCSAEQTEHIEQISQMAQTLGINHEFTCQLGIGAPNDDWAKVILLSLNSLSALPTGSVTLLDRDVQLNAEADIEEAVFRSISATFEKKLPDGYFLETDRSDKKVEVATESEHEFVATKSPEGLVQLRGTLRQEMDMTIFESLSRARFGGDNLYMNVSHTAGLAAHWDNRSLVALEVLALMKNGVVRVASDLIDISGTTHDPAGQSVLNTVLSTKLSEKDKYQIEMAYIPLPDPDAHRFDGATCERKIEERLAIKNIKFEPGSDRVNVDGLRGLDAIAKILKNCVDVGFEIAGHTDSQGRAEMNKVLSQSRANAVLRELQRRRISTAKYTAKGYGEDKPIAKNDTVEGREANRRIEFRLISDKPLAGNGVDEMQESRVNE